MKIQRPAVSSLSCSDGRPLSVLKGHKLQIQDTQILLDGRILSWSDDGTLRLWSNDGVPLTVLEGHAGWVMGAQILADGRILSWAKDRALRLWDGRSGRCHAILEGHTAPVVCAQALTDGRILSWSWDNTLRLWDNDGRMIETIQIKKLFSAPKEIWQTFLENELTSSISGIYGLANTVYLGVESSGAPNCIQWHGKSDCTARHLFDDGRSFITQGNGQVCQLKVYVGNEVVVDMRKLAPSFFV